MKLSVIVPVYNSELILHDLVMRLHSVLKVLTDNYELILVNDGSCDRSWDTICQLAENNDWIKGIDLMRNYGQHNALLAGIRAAKYEMIVTLDDDLQHPPEEIPKLLNRLTEGFDVVYGSPQKEPHGFRRGLASLLTKIALQSVMGIKTARHVSAFRAFHTNLRNAFAGYQSPFISIDVLLSWGTTRFSAVNVQHNQRQVGVSNYTFWRLVIHAVNMITGFSTWPLKLANLMGFTFTLFGFFVLIYVLGRYLLEGSSVAGFPFLASIIAIFSGVQLFALGIIGEYLSRMHFRTMERPVYVIRENKTK